MNRRELLQAAGAAVAAGLLPPAQADRVLSEPLELIWQDVEIVVSCEFSMADMAYLICARCYDPPLIYTDHVTDSAIVEQGWSLAMLKAILKMKMAMCKMAVREELHWLADQQRNSPMQINGLAGFLTTPTPPTPSE